MAKNVKRVLIYRLGSLGDHIVALPCLHLVARMFPSAGRRMLSNVPVSAKAPAAAAILTGSGLVDGYFRYTVGMRNPFSILRLWAQLLLWRPDVLVYLTAARGVEVARRDRLFFQLCGIRRRNQIGVPDTADLQSNRLQLDGWTYEAEAARLARNLSPLGDAHLESPESWNLHLTEVERRRALDALAPAGDAPFIAVSLGTKRQCNDWGAERWRALLVRLGAMLPGYALLLNGAPDEREISEAAADGWREGNAGPVLNVCGVLSPRESATALARAAVYIGHDSGPMHLAAAVQTPIVAIFSARVRSIG